MAAVEQQAHDDTDPEEWSEVVVIGGGIAGLAAAGTQIGLVTLFEGSGLYGSQVATVGHLMSE